MSMGRLVQATKHIASNQDIAIHSLNTTSPYCHFNEIDWLADWLYLNSFGLMQCAGLRLIPGMTKSGLQKEKTPERKFLEFLTGAKDEGQ